MTSKKRGYEEKINPARVIRYAVERGMKGILEHNPGITRKYLEYHLDQDRLAEESQEILHELKYKNWSNEEKAQYLYKTLASYVASLRAFDKTGQKAVFGETLKGTLEGKVKHEGILSGIFKRKLRGEEDFYEATQTLRDLILLSNNGENLKDMPRVAEALHDAYSLHVLGPMLETLKSHHRINQKTFEEWYRIARQGVYSLTEKAVGGIGEYINKIKEKLKRPALKTATAIIFGLLGLAFLIFSRFSLTGNVISSPEGTYSMTGILSILISAVLFFMSLKTKTKRI